MVDKEKAQKIWPEVLKAKCDLCAEATIKTFEAIDREFRSGSVIREMEAAVAARIVDKLITGFAKKMSKLCGKYLWLDEALTVELHFGTKPQEGAQAGGGEMREDIIIADGMHEYKNPEWYEQLKASICTSGWDKERSNGT